MMAFEFQVFLAILITHAVFIHLGRYSLDYNIIKYKVTLDNLKEFLDNLTFPANIFYGFEASQKLFLILAQKSGTENITQSINEKKLARLLFSLIPAFLIGCIIVAVLKGFSEKSSPVYIITYSLWLIFACFSMYKAWNFGSLLKISQ